MGKQINQYTKTRTAATIQGDDLLGPDSTEDTGTTFESAKMKVSELLAYINANVNNLYNADGSLTGSRNVTLDNHTLSFIQGKIRFKSTGGDIPFSLDNSSGVERVKLEYGTTLDSGSLTLSNTAGDFFSASDGFVSVNGATQGFTEKLGVLGLVRFSSGLGLFNAEPKSTTALNVPNNKTVVSFNNSASYYQLSNEVCVRAVNTDVINFLGIVNGTSLGAFSLATLNGGINNELNLTSYIASTTTTIRNTIYKSISSYYDGSTNNEKEASYAHNITNATTGESQLDFSIAGTDILTLKDTGVLNASNLPTSSAGLVTGDLWNNSGVINII